MQNQNKFNSFFNISSWMIWRCKIKINSIHFLIFLPFTLHQHCLIVHRRWYCSRSSETTPVAPNIHHIFIIIPWKKKGCIRKEFFAQSAFIFNHHASKEEVYIRNIYFSSKEHQIYTCKIWRKPTNNFNRENYFPFIKRWTILTAFQWLHQHISIWKSC